MFVLNCIICELRQCCYAKTNKGMAQILFVLNTGFVNLMYIC